MSPSRRPVRHESMGWEEESNPILTKLPRVKSRAAEGAFRWKMEGSGGGFRCQAVQ